MSCPLQSSALTFVLPANPTANSYFNSLLRRLTHRSGKLPRFPGKPVFRLSRVYAAGQRLSSSFKDDFCLLTFASAGIPESRSSRFPGCQPPFFRPPRLEACLEPYTSIDTKLTSVDSGAADSADSAFAGNG